MNLNDVIIEQQLVWNYVYLNVIIQFCRNVFYYKSKCNNICRQNERISTATLSLFPYIEDKI